MVIGPNGSGKSSIVCALALGLGGSPKLLSRADNLKGFVQNGQKSAMIEIELVDKTEKKFQIVRRLFNSEDNKSKWTWNGEPIGEKSVQSKLKEEYQTQVDNLCQFLPQDKVAYFSRLNNQELLKETIRAALGQEWVDEQDKLIQTQNRINESANSAAAQKKRLEDLDDRLKLMETQVEIYQKREEIKNDVRLHEGKFQYLKYSREKQEYGERKQAFKVCAEQWKVVQEKLKPLDERAKYAKIELDKVSSSQTDLKLSSFESAFNKAQIHRSKLASKLGDKVSAIDNEFNQKMEGELYLRDAETELGKTKLVEDKFERENAQLSPTGLRELKKRIRTLNEPVNRLDEKCSLAQHEIKTQLLAKESCEKKLFNIQRLANDKENRFGKIRDGRERDKLQGAWKRIQERLADSGSNDEVYLPLLEIEIDDALVCHQFEHSVSMNNLTTFVTKSRLAQQILNEINGVNVMRIVESRPEESPVSSALKSKYSIKGRMSELIKAPRLVVMALENMAAIDKVLCGTSRTDDGMKDADLSDLVGYRLLTERTEYAVKRSKYGEKKISSQNGNLKSRTGTFSVQKDYDSQGKRTALESELATATNKLAQAKETESALRQKFFDAKEILGEAMAEKTELTKLLTKQQMLQRAVTQAAENVMKAKTSMNEDVTHSIRKHIDVYMSSKADILQSISETVKQSVKFTESQSEWLKSKLLISKAQAIYDEAADAAREARAQENLLKKQVSHLDSETKECKNRVKASLAKFKAMMPDAIDDGPVSVALSNLSDVMEDIHAQLTILKTKLERMVDDPNIILSFSKLKAEADDLRPQVSNSESIQAAERAQFENEREIWMTKITELISKINIKYMESFLAIQARGFSCDGEVVPLKDIDNLAQFGVGINVRFRRDAPLQRLSVNTQSGGERSLCTFMYILSLNELSYCPFRVVDEINQGMDEEKERISYYQLVKQSCGDIEKAQYFLITPKLLLGLEYHQDTTIHVIYNGVGALPQQDFDFQTITENKKRHLAETSVQTRKRAKV